jgi:hypothetical protein
MRTVHSFVMSLEPVLLGTQPAWVQPFLASHSSHHVQLQGLRGYCCCLCCLSSKLRVARLGSDFEGFHFLTNVTSARTPDSFREHSDTISQAPTWPFSLSPHIIALPECSQRHHQCGEFFLQAQLVFLSSVTPFPTNSELFFLWVHVPIKEVNVS